MPWDRAAEIATVLGPTYWTLVGGLMAQLHGVAAGVPSRRPTDDVDMLLHIETDTGVLKPPPRYSKGLGTSSFRPSVRSTSLLIVLPETMGLWLMS